MSGAAITDSPFASYMRSMAHRRTYLDPLGGGNNGDTLILMGMKHILEKCQCDLVESPGEAEQIVINGGGSMTDIWGDSGVQVLRR